MFTLLSLGEEPAPVLQKESCCKAQFEKAWTWKDQYSSWSAVNLQLPSHSLEVTLVPLFHKYCNIKCGRKMSVPA